MLTRAFLALMGLSCAAEAQDPNLTITWIGQSCFVMRTDGGPTVITDPPAASVGYTLPRLAADAVTITHNHTDHNNAVAVGGTFTLVDGRPVSARQEVTAAGLTRPGSGQRNGARRSTGRATHQVRAYTPTLRAAPGRRARKADKIRP